MKDRQWYRERSELVKEYGEPPFDVTTSLRHTLDVFADSPDDSFVVRATSNKFDDGVTTGLTWGDLRYLATQLGVEFKQGEDG
jgi:hypothetical protein